MSVVWNWNKKMGHIECFDNTGGYKINVYQGNCICERINEKGKDNHFYTFFYDELHLKKCIGLEAVNGKKKNLFYGVWKKWKLNTFFTESITIAKILVEAGYCVELYYKEINS